ncbi:MAG: two-component system response regulator LytT [Algoriphagus sp.]|jgi:two-component system response regulator LytT
MANYAQKSYKKRFLTKLGKRFSFVMVEHVSYFYSEGGMTFLVQNDSDRRQLISHTLNELESELLDPMTYYRVNRSMIINSESLAEIKPYLNSRV